MVGERDDADRRFRAALHGVKLQEPDGRVHGMRQRVMAGINQRQQHRRR